jgi:hypothetical protein
MYYNRATVLSNIFIHTQPCQNAYKATFMPDSATEENKGERQSTCFMSRPHSWLMTGYQRHAHWMNASAADSDFCFGVIMLRINISCCNNSAQNIYFLSNISSFEYTISRIDYASNMSIVAKGILGPQKLSTSSMSGRFDRGMERAHTSPRVFIPFGITYSRDSSI